MRSIDLLAAIYQDQGVDLATQEVKKEQQPTLLSTMEYMYLKIGQELVSQIEVLIESEKIVFKVNRNYKKYTVNELKNVLMTFKSFTLYMELLDEQPKIIRGIRLVNDGIILG